MAPSTGKPYAKRRDLKHAQRILLKLGSAVVSRTDGEGVALPVLSSLVEEISAFHKAGIKFIIVSSGAVAYGKKIIQKICPGKGPLNIAEKRAAAAIGQPKLMFLYETLFEEYNLPVAQVLISNGIKNQEEAMNIIKCTVNELLSLNVIPIVNTNDAVNLPEFSDGVNNRPHLYDNDALALALAVDLDADVIIMATNVEGVYDKPPGEQDSTLITHFSPNIMKTIMYGDTSDVGTGGMISKASAALDAVKKGVSAVICNGRRLGVLSSLLQGEKVGTFFSPINDS